MLHDGPSPPTGDDAPSPASPARSNLVLWLLGVLVLGAVVAGAVAGVLRQPAALDPSTPEGVVQAYLQAVIAGDHEAAGRHLEPGLADRCDGLLGGSWVPESLSATLESVEVDGDSATVHIRMTSVSGPLPPLGSGQHSFTERFSLARAGGTWRLDAAPWPVYHCPPEPR